MQAASAAPPRARGCAHMTHCVPRRRCDSRIGGRALQACLRGRGAGGTGFRAGSRMCSRAGFIAAVTAPLWLPLVVVAAAASLVWSAVGATFEYATAGGVAVVGALAGVTAAAGAAEGVGAGGWRSVTWDAGVVATAAAAAAAVATATDASAARRHARAVAAVGAVASLVYVAVKGGVWAGAPLSSLQVAMLVVAAVLPAHQLVAAARLWRYASPEGAAAAERRILAAAGDTPFTQYTVAGMHTVEYGRRGSAVVPNPLQARSSSSSSGGGEDTRPAIVFCHGYMSGTAMYMYNLDAFTAEYRVFSVDWRGCGSSPRPRYTPTTTAATEEWFLEALEAWRVAQRLERMVLVGHSMGGYLAAVYTMRHAARVRHLVLVSPGGVPNYGLDPKSATGGMVRSNPASPTPRPIPRWLWSTVAWAWDNDVTAGALLRWAGPCGRALARAGVRGRFSRLVLARPVPPALLADMGDYYYHNIAADGSGEYALRHIFAPGARGRHPVGDRLLAAARDGTLPPTLPVTILYGGTHDWMSLAGGTRLVEGLTAAGFTATVGTVSPGGHHLYLESPDTFNATVLAALAAAERSRTRGHGSPAPTPAPAPASTLDAPAGTEGPEADAVGSPRVSGVATGPLANVMSAVATME